MCILFHTITSKLEHCDEEGVFRKSKKGANRTKIGGKRYQKEINIGLTYLAGYLNKSDYLVIFTIFIQDSSIYLINLFTK